MASCLPLRLQTLKISFNAAPLADPSRHRPPRLPPAIRWSSSLAQETDKAPTPPSEAVPSSSALPSPFFCTTPIFYVNASPHVGHLHSDVLADVLTRWSSLRHSGWSPAAPAGKGKTQPLLSTGTDEHGLKIQKVAEMSNEDPQALCDRISQIFRILADTAGVGYTDFIRTTEDRHKVAVHEIWRRLVDAGHIYKGAHEGWYAVSDEAFYPPAQVRSVTDDKTGEKYHEAIETGQRVEWTSEDNYKFRLSAFKDKLVEWLESTPDAILPPSRHAEVLEEIKTGLEDLSVSRPSSRLSWGLPVPNDASQSIYVWIDALVNYITVAGFPWKAPTGQHQVEGEASATSEGEIKGTAEWEGSAWPADVHVVGKDILRFHAVYWPALLLAAGLPLPRKIVAHSHWTMGKSKMSKSKGNVVDPFEEIDKYGQDVVRYFLCRVGGNLATDSDYSTSTLLEYHRKYLGGQLGNLLSRITSPLMQELLLGELQEKRKQERGDVTKEEKDRLKPLSVRRHVKGGARLIEVKRPRSGERHEELEAAMNALGDKVDSCMQRGEVSKALEVIFDLLAQVNAYLQEVEPWRKSPQASTHRLSAIFYTREALRIAGTMLLPFMPGKMRELLETGLDLDWRREEGMHWDEVRKMRGRVAFLEKEEKLLPLFPRLVEEQPVGKAGGRGGGGGGGGGEKDRKDKMSGGKQPGGSLRPSSS